MPHTFMNVLNSTSRTYQGYTRADQPLEEQENEAGSNGEEDDLEAGRSRVARSAKARGKRRVAWDGGASELRVLHPNIHGEDPIHDRGSDDDEVPHSFKVETTTPRATTSKPSRTRDHDSSFGVRRTQPLHSVAGRAVPPSTLPKSLHPPVSPPSRLSEVDRKAAADPTAQSLPQFSETSSNVSSRSRPLVRGLDNYERALWNWVNVYNLDAFLQEVYAYYEGKGIYSIALARGLNLLTVGFVIGFSTFLLGCINYSRLQHQKSTQLSDVIVERCVSKFSGFTLLFFLLFTAFYVWQIISFVMGISRLVDMYNFYTYLLKIPDADIQTISWSEIVRRIGLIREENPLTAISSKGSRNHDDTTTAKLDAHDIANRIMRQENYLIALFNKELLDLRTPLPYIFKKFLTEEEGKGKVLTQALEWNLRFCLMEYLFDQHGKVRKVFLKSKNRVALIEGLRRRFIFMGILNAMFAPFIVPYLLMYSFFRYFEQYHKDPSSIGGRRYTSFAQWKFREFNELPHFFTRRLDESYPLASMYIGQFPNEKMTLIMRFVAFIAGSFAAVLFLATILDPDLFLNFEITPHRTVFFYLGVFGAILTVARGMVPEDNRVFDPELLMKEVITYTHYMPDEWDGQLHSKKVHQEFGELFAMKVLIFVQELLSVILTPFVLWFSLPACAPAIIDFFREFSVHVDGRGYVCSFAEFNFERHGNVKFGAPTRPNDERMVSNEGKMEKSFLNFKAANPAWNPTDPSGSLYLSRITDLSGHLPYALGRRRHPYYAGGTTELSGTVHFGGERKADIPPANEGQDYDRALRRSQHAAVTRRRAPGSSYVGPSTLAPGPSASSVFDGLSTAQTTVLGDSQGSVRMTTTSHSGKGSNIPLEDVAEDGSLGSGLGGSYVDGGKQVKPYGDGGDEDEDGLEDGGVLGLLAQIYGRTDGPKGVIS